MIQRLPFSVSVFSFRIELAAGIEVLFGSTERLRSLTAFKRYSTEGSKEKKTFYRWQ